MSDCPGMSVWVDTDFGFDDLWALLLLRSAGISIAGVSLVAGNCPLPQVAKNAVAASVAFDFKWPTYAGADKPLYRKQETAKRILGELGMQTRGLTLPYSAATAEFSDGDSFRDHQHDATEALYKWLAEPGPHHIIALGPLSNIARLLQTHPTAASLINRLVWLGGSQGRGNHSEWAEFNALADPDSAALVIEHGVPLTMIELELCRRVTFDEDDIPALSGPNRELLHDLLGGYLDIALSRGRLGMSIYDPLAALALIKPDLYEFHTGSLQVHTKEDSHYGQTLVSLDSHQSSSVLTGKFEVASGINVEAAKSCCLSALIAA